jgi:hypothetical protein
MLAWKQDAEIGSVSGCDMVVYHSGRTNIQIAAQQRHAPDAATRPEIAGILECDFVPSVIAVY